jgi:hypothetical protein
MTGTDVALVISASGTVITAVGGVIIAIISRKTNIATHEVHTMVNQQRTDALRYQTALIKSLRKAGVAVPDDQSLTLTNEEGSRIDG